LSILSFFLCICSDRLFELIQQFIRLCIEQFVKRLLPPGGVNISLKLKVADTTPNLKLKLKALFKNPQPDWGAGSNLGDTFWVFRVFDPTNDSGKVDDQNIYAVIYGIDSMFNGIAGRAQKFATSNLIAPTFTFGDAYSDTPDFYQYGMDSMDTNPGMGTIYHTSLAYYTNNGWFNGILGATINQNDGSNVSQTIKYTKFKFNDTTGDITVYLATFVDYISGPMGTGTYGVRSKIIGNMLTHNFFVHVQKGNVISNCFQLIGKGVSQGSNSYYMTYVENWNDSGNAGFYKFSATADESYFEDMQTNHILKASNLNVFTDDTNGCGVYITNYITNGYKYTNSFDASSYLNGGILIINP
jgi:hypothetical protein